MKDAIRNAEQNQIQAEECEIGIAIGQQRERNKQQAVISRANEWKRNLTGTYQLVLKLQLGTVVVQFFGVARSDHVSRGVKLPEIGTAAQRGRKNNEPRQKLNTQNQRENPEHRLQIERRNRNLFSRRVILHLLRGLFFPRTLRRCMAAWASLCSLVALVR